MTVRIFTNENVRVVNISKIKCIVHILAVEKHTRKFFNN